MRFGTRAVNLPGGISFDGWDTVLGGALACLLIGAITKEARFLIAVGAVLLVVWLVLTVLANTGQLPREAGPTADGGDAPPSAGPGPAAGQPQD